MTDSITHHLVNRSFTGMVCVYCGRTATELRAADPTTEPTSQVCDKVKAGR